MLGNKRPIIWLIIFESLSFAPAEICRASEDGSTIELAAVGDVMLSGGVQKRIEEFGPDYPFEKVDRVVSQADLAFCNLECPISCLGVSIIKPNVFGVKPQEAKGLSFAGFDIISLANNHALDMGRKGLLGTMKFLEDEQIQYVGAGEIYREAKSPVILSVKGITVAFLAYCLYPLEGVVFKEESPSVALYNPVNVRCALEELRRKVDLIVVSLHWGTEYAKSPSAEQREKAHRLIDWGADLILGHHPHVVQEIEEYKGGVIVYSLGNFVFDQRKKETKKSMIFKAKLSKRGVREYSILPVRIEGFRPVLSTDVTDRSTDVTD